MFHNQDCLFKIFKYKKLLELVFVIRFSFLLFQNAPIRNRKPLILNQIANINLNKLRSADKLTFIQQKDHFFVYLNSASEFNTGNHFT